MKNILLPLALMGLLGGCFHVTSARALPPPNMCPPDSPICSQSQKYIEQKFGENSGLLKQPLGQQIYSGACYINGRGYNPDHKHWGVVFFDLKDPLVFFGARFGFFFKQNPYTEFTATDAREQFTSMYKDDHRTEINNDYAFVHLNPESNGVYYYWFTQNPESLTVYVKAFWTINYMLFCELQPNLNQGI